MGVVSVQPVAQLPGCRWDASDGSAVTVQVANGSSSSWAVQLPGIEDSLRSGGVPITGAVKAGLAEAQTYVDRGQEVDADLACALFTDLAEATGAAPGSDNTVLVNPSPSDPRSISTQACNNDEYTFVQLVAPGLADGLEARTAEVRPLLQQVHGAPLSP